jgi:hypothetical protein
VLNDAEPRSAPAVSSWLPPCPWSFPVWFCSFGQWAASVLLIAVHRFYHRHFKSPDAFSLFYHNSGFNFAVAVHHIRLLQAQSIDLASISPGRSVVVEIRLAAIVV